MKTLVASFSLLFIFSFSTRASHIVGGEMHFQYMGDSIYHIELIVNRNCNSTAQAPYNNPLYLAVYDSTGDTISWDSIPFPGADTLSNNTFNPCLISPSDICFQEAIYEADLYLPPITGGYVVVWQCCCRNGALVNIPNPTNTGATYMAHIPVKWAYHDSDPLFNNVPPTILCAGYPFAFDNSATDLDGDSLVYFLCAPFTCPSQNLNAPGPPPYDSVIYYTGYTSQNPLGGTVPLKIDRKTGLLTCTPVNLGAFIVCTAVAEYRNGELLSIHKRDIQFNVAPCSAVTASFTSSDSLSVVSFNSSGSLGAASYVWNFGDGSAVDTVAIPVHTYSANGVYSVCLTITSSNGCATKVCQKVAVGVPNTCFADFALYPDSLIAHNWFALDESYGAPPISYLWSWGDGTSSTGATPSHIYSNSGFYTICLTINDDSACTSTICDSAAYLYRTENNTPVTINVVTSLPNSINPIPLPLQKHLAVNPNPCSYCEVRGINNVSDITITDVLGRKVAASFIQTAGGYMVSFPYSTSGLYIIRNTVTGEAVKFIKE